MNIPLATNYNELTTAYNSRVPEVIVKGNLIEVLKTVNKGQISDESRMGTELGSGGLALVFESLHLMAHRLITGKNAKTEKLKDNIGLVYHIALNGDDSIYLRLKSLDY